MTVKERILAIRMLEKQECNPEYTKKLGIQVQGLKKKTQRKETKNV